MTETDAQRIPRMLALVPWLQQRPGITLQETAEHFGVTHRQLSHDLWQLVLCGLPGYGPDQLIDIDFWDDDRIWVRNAQTLELPMRLTPEEAGVLSMALRMIAQVPGISERSALNSLIGRLEQHLPALTVDPLIISPDVLEPISHEIDTALKSGSKVELEYASATDHVSSRVVNPIRVFLLDDYSYLEAWCEKAEAIRLFRLDRILSIQRHPDPAFVPIDTSPPSLMKPGHLPGSRTARILVTEESQWLAEETWLIHDRENPASLYVPYLSEDWLIRWVLSFGGSVQLVEPSSLKEQIYEVAVSSLKRIHE